MKVTCKKCKNEIPVSIVPNFSQKIQCTNCWNTYEYSATFKMVFKIFQYVIVVIGLLCFYYFSDYLKNALGMAGNDLKTILIYIVIFVAFMVVFTIILGIVHKIMLIIFKL